MKVRWLDNLIPLRWRLNQSQLAGWTPTAIAAQGLGCRLLSDVAIAMPDGVKLAADVYIPAVPGRYPVILQFAPYNLSLHTTGLPRGSSEIGSPPVSTGRGYCQVVVTARGVGRSQGRLQPWHCAAETDDHLACIAWAATQPWSNGDVSLFGTSYYGMNQAAVAARRPPALKAFFANEISTNYRRHLVRYGGVFNADFLSLWAGANFTSQTIRRRVPPWLRALLSQVFNRAWTWRATKPRIDGIMQGFKRRRVVPEALAWFLALMTNDSTSVPGGIFESPSTVLGQIDVPFVVVQNRGMVALHQFGAYDLFDHGGTRVERKWLIIGPPEYELPVYSWQLEALAFFDYVLKGIDNGYAKQPRVRYWRDGPDDWAEADDLPPPQAETTKLHLGRVTAAQGGILSVDPPAPAVSSWLSVPRGITVLPGLDALEPQMLRFAFTAREDFELVGPVTLQLRYGCSDIDSYVVVRLDRIDHSHRRRCLGMGHMRPSLRRIDSARGSRCEIAISVGTPEPLISDEPVMLRFSLTPAAALVRAGETLELDIASRTDLFKLAVSEGFVVPDMPVPPYFARNIIHHGPDSFLEITARYYIGAT